MSSKTLAAALAATLTLLPFAGMAQVVTTPTPPTSGTQAIPGQPIPLQPAPPVATTTGPANAPATAAPSTGSSSGGTGGSSSGQGGGSGG